ncbi:uncharacterized protein VTP21DRAFT_6680 [Calcarisporiella thermophila]|uniref:uncharacterized protein n=1 Tax=Calcarisporiella thermophila TaxID=911321 RepID=UPI003742CDBB
MSEKTIHTKIPSPPKEAQEFVNFVTNSPSPFHAVEESCKRLRAAGFQELKERDAWKVQPNGKYYFTRNRSSVVAFAVGGNYAPGNGFTILGAHTDSPCLKVKPVSKRESMDYLQVGVELYGGGIWHSWFDRDLSVAGRVLVQQNDNTFKHTLVKIDRPLLRIPTLAIHLDRTVNEGFKFNTETQLLPIIATTMKGLLESEPNNDKAKAEKHHPLLISILAEEIGCNLNQIKDFELCLYDTQPPCIGGAANEFIFSPRLDNLNMSYCSLMALINSSQSPQNLSSDPNIRVIALFDNEEVGSLTAHGANSNLLATTIERLALLDIEGKTRSPTALQEALVKSYLISADMAHAVHPNYSDKYEQCHRPRLNQGVVIKINANQRYATTGPTALVLREVAHKHNIPIQDFVVRNDSPCGSTIGPMLSAKLGLRTIDVGNPQLSMHSIRETGGVDDVGHAIKLFEAFFNEFAALDAKLEVD